MGAGNTAYTNLPNVILLLGAFLPKTEAGTMVGKPARATVPAVALTVFFKKTRRLVESFFSVILNYLMLFFIKKCELLNPHFCYHKYQQFSTNINPGILSSAGTFKANPLYPLF
jgi:hypothetical protein